MISVAAHMLSAAVAGWALYAFFKSAIADTGHARLWWAASCGIALANLLLMFTFMRG